MYYLEVSIAGECGIATGSSVSNGSILIHQARMISSSLNHVMLTIASRNAEEALNRMNKDFSGYTSHISGNCMFIDSYKRGHGVLKAFKNLDAFLQYPIIANNGVEIFRLLSREKDILEQVERNLETGNKVERTVFKTVSLSEAFDRLPNAGYQSSLYGLTDKELETMKNALNMGYYEWPRTGDLDAISRQNNSSKVTTLYHIRKAERKIIESIFRRTT